MPTRKPSKSPSKSSKKAGGAKRTKAKGGAVLPLEPLYPHPVKMRWPKKGSGVQMVRIWGGFDDDDIPSDMDLGTVGRMPNPMPDNIVSLLKLASEATWITIPLAPYIYLLIKSWFAGRNSRKLKIRKGEAEVEFEGAWSESKLRKAFDHFRRMTKDEDDDSIQVIENGKVIERVGAPAYKIKQADIERARELQSRASKAKTRKKVRTKSKRK
jgi:hypothetical protein